MTNVIVTTTINPPTEAIRRFDALPDWHLIVIGDRKTPPDYRLGRGLYVPPEEQEKFDKPLSDSIGWNCMERRNFGFLLAKEMGADVIATVDDDNVPMEGWGQNLMLGREVPGWWCPTTLPAFDPVGFCHSELWHRGYPLELVGRREYLPEWRDLPAPDVQADLWNGAPDIDAICRVGNPGEFTFRPHMLPIASDKPAPFNSQNTFMLAHVLPLYFLWPGVGRSADIWASYHVQARGKWVTHGAASVIQKRNPHDLIADMKAEYLGYENNLRLVQDLAINPEHIRKYLPERAVEAWALYRRHFG